MTRREKNWKQEQRLQKTERLLLEAARELHWPDCKRFSAFFGQPDYTVQRGRSYDKGFKLYLTVPIFWLESVQARGLTLIENCLVLEAEEVLAIPPAEACWKVVSISCDAGANFSLRQQCAVRYGGLLLARYDWPHAIQNAIAKFHSALTGIDEPPF